MPRNHHPAASTLRNRNRITNKTRLKIHQGSPDADAVLIPDEDEEKYRLTNLVAGVDAEDANEHHLQEVLSAAHRNSANSRHPRGTDNKSNVVSQSAFIPTPDSTGIVDNYEEWYPTHKWKDPATYVCTSTTVEETSINGLSGGFVYYMDERDQAWLDKNNEEARGEGTSVQGAVSVSGTRASARSAKAKGKEPEPCHPTTISEDEFELVMGLYEKITHERTEYLHHGLETGMEFPAFADYQDVFSSPLAPTVFATYIPPSWIPEPQALLRIAMAVYPHWKERRVDRGGHRIIPTLNGDESDTLNESYICFRRREIKAVRKTRASQATSSDKLVRLQHELTYPLELAKSLLIRETLKKDNAVLSQDVWEKRLAFADLKLKFPMLNDKVDEELLVDKERPAKKPDASRVPLKLRPHDDPPSRPEALLRPKERVTMIRDLVETTLARQKDLDHHWEDQVDNPYQASPIPYASRLFKYIPPPDAPFWPSSNSDTIDDDPPSHSPAPRMVRAVRKRYGRGGRIHLDRRNGIPPTLATARLPRSTLFDIDESMDIDEEHEGERRRQLEERWRFDSDDAPPVGPDGLEEQDRTLVDDYETMHMRHTMTLFTDIDHAYLLTDPTLVIQGAEGGSQIFLPYRLGMQQSMMRRDAQGVLRPLQPTMNGIVPVHPIAGVAALNGHQIKKMPPPNTGLQMRISSNGGMRPPMTPVSNLHSNGGSSSHQISPPQTLPVPVAQHPSSMTGVSRAAINLPQVDVRKPTDIIGLPAIPNGIPLVTVPQPDVNGSGNVEVRANGSPPRPKPQNQNPTTPQPQPQPHLGTAIPINGYHLSPLAAAYSHNQSPPQLSNISNGGGGLSQQQMRDLKSVFANMPNPELGTLQNASRAVSGPYMHLGPIGPNMNGIQLLPGTNIGNLKLSPATAAAARQMQWGTMATANVTGSPIMQMQQIQRPGSVVNGNHLMDGQLAVNGGNALPSPNLGAVGLPGSPSANGIRSGLRNGMLVNGQPHSMSPHMRHSPSPLPNISHLHSQSPTRMPMAPNMTIIGSSPSLQHQQPPQTQSIGSTLNGY